MTNPIEDVNSFLTFRHPLSSLKKYKYPTLDFKEKKISFEKAKAKVKILLENSIKRFLKKGKQPAVMMSNGVDSVLLAAIIKKIQGHVKVYTASFANKEISEAEDSIITAKKLGFEQVIVPIVKEDYLDVEKFLKPLIKHKGEPLHPNEIALAKCEQKAKEDGCDIAFCGEGSDDIFGGYSKIFTFHKTLASEKETLLSLFLDFYRYFSLETKDKIIRPNYIMNDIDLLKKYFPEYKKIPHHQFGMQFVQRIHTPGLIKRGMNAMTWNGLKPAFPYQDKALVKFVNSLPIDYKISGDKVKYILREIAIDYIGEFAYSKKHPFPIPFEDWMKFKDWDLSWDLFIPENFYLLNGWQKWMIINLDIWWRELFHNLWEEKK